MSPNTTLSIQQVRSFLLHVAPSRPVFLWGPPGVGKRPLVEQFAHDIGLECVSLLGSQLAPEDLIGISAHRRPGEPLLPARDDRA